jgi:hypothetical protein
MRSKRTGTRTTKLTKWGESKKGGGEGRWGVIGYVKKVDVRRFLRPYVLMLSFPIRLLMYPQKKALRTHQHISHLKRRDFLCRVKGCTREFGYKHLLKRHIERDHVVESESEEEEESGKLEEEARDEGGETVEQGWSIDFITGAAYARAHEDAPNVKPKVKCPHPSMEGFPNPSSCHHSVVGEGSAQVGDCVPACVNEGRDVEGLGESRCKFIFSRAYDLRRHLGSVHGMEYEKEVVDRWFARRTR